MSDGVVALQHVVADYAEEIEQVMLDQDWEKLTIILQQRQKLFEEKIAPLSADSRIELVGVIEKIQQEDADFLAVLQEKKQELEKKMHYIRQGRKSIKAYGA
jgi:hypothetical protein